MVENDDTTAASAQSESTPDPVSVPSKPVRRRRTASRPAGPPVVAEGDADASATGGAVTSAAAPALETAAEASPAAAGDEVAVPGATRTRAPRKTAAKRTSKKAVAPVIPDEATDAVEAPAVEAPAASTTADLADATESAAAPDDAPRPRPRRTRKVAVKKAAASTPPAAEVEAETPEPAAVEPATFEPAAVAPAAAEPAPEPLVPGVLFQAPGADPVAPARRRRRATAPQTNLEPAQAQPAAEPEATAVSDGAAGVEMAAPVVTVPALTFGAPTEEPAAATRPRRRRAVRSQSPVSELGSIDPVAEQAVAAAELLLDATAAGASTADADVIDPDLVDPDLVDADGSDLAADLEESDSGDSEDEDEQPSDTARRRRRRGGRGRRSRGRSDSGDIADADAHEGEPADGQVAGSTAEQAVDDEQDPSDPASTEEGEDQDDDASGTSRRRRRRRRRGNAEDADAAVTEETERPAARTREPREPREPRQRRSRGAGGDEDEVQSLRGSTRLEAKKQRRREGRELGRRRTPLLTEAEFLARREAVERTMVVRQRGKRIQIAVLEDDMLVEHYIDNGDTGSLVGNVFLGRVQNVLPSMEAAFLDLGKGRNAVLYAGEVNWDAVGMEGQPKRIELALKSGDPVLVQVTKDPIGSKGARLTSQISLPGRFLVYVPGGSMTGISRKLPENERTRLKSILRRVVPEDAGVIVRTAAEGASEEDIAADVERLQEQWEQIQRASATATAPALLHGEPDLTVRVLRDVFNEDFRSVVVSGDSAWNTVEPYIRSVAPELAERVTRWTGTGDVFAAHRIDEQLVKALDRKVFLPSGGSLVIDRTEAMVVIDVNTGRFIGKGGNLEETVTKNNIEAAEEIVRQLRLRDMGGIIVIDFIDMVLESNRDLVMRRLLECLGRDRTKHQVAEVTSLGLVQMTRKRVGTGLLEAFSEPCEHCKGRGVIVSLDGAPADHAVHAPEQPARRNRPLVTPGAAPSPALLAPVQATPIETDPVAAEDPVAEVPTASPTDPTPAPVVDSAPLLTGPDPVAESVDEGRPQRRRRRATRP